MMVEMSEPVTGLACEQSGKANLDFAPASCFRVHSMLS